MTPFILEKYYTSKIFLQRQTCNLNLKFGAERYIRTEIRNEIKQININEKLHYKSFSENVWLIYFDGLQRNIQESVKYLRLAALQKITNDLKPVTISAKHFILDVWQGSEYVSKLSNYLA